MKCSQCQREVEPNEQVGDVCHDCIRKMFVKKGYLEMALKEVAPYAYRHPPVTSKGRENWTDTMKTVSEVLNWPVCDACEGKGFLSEETCWKCDGIGRLI